MEQKKDGTYAEKMNEEKDASTWKGTNTIIDDKELDNDLNLNKGKYQIMSQLFDVRINKRPGLKLETYDHLRNFQHENVIPHLDFYIQAQKYPRLVIPKVHSSFQCWFDKRGKSVLFDETGHMTTIFQNLIIEYCDLIENLLKLDLIFQNFQIENMFVNIYDDVPTLRVMLTEVVKVPCLSTVHEKLTWDSCRKFISWCEEQCQITRDHPTKKFCAFLGKSNCTVAKLKRYPHNWDDAMKGEYLMSLVASDHSAMRTKLRCSGLKWPFIENPSHIGHTLPDLLQKILDWDKSKNRREQNTSDFFSYIIVLRNCYKHYKDLPEEIKVILNHQRALILHIEQWSPDFWTKLYEIIGWV